jgi:hypothetical protein
MDRYLRIRIDHLEGCLDCAHRLEALGADSTRRVGSNRVGSAE